MKENVIVEFAIQKIEYEKDGNILSVDDAMCFRIVYPADDEFKNEAINLTMNKNAKKDLIKYLRLANHHGKSKFFIGIYEDINGMNMLHLIRALKCI